MGGRWTLVRCNVGLIIRRGIALVKGCISRSLCRLSSPIATICLMSKPRLVTSGFRE